MIQDISPSVFSNSYQPILPLSDSSVLYFDGDSMLTDFDGGRGRLVFPRRKDFAGEISAVYAFSIDGRPFFLALGRAKAPEGYALHTMRELRTLPLANNADIFAAYCAYHLWKWYSASRFCGACGAKTELDAKERAVYCPRCREKTYPRINPAVIVGVVNGDRLLLTRYRTGYAHNALIAGFTEFGETMEQTVAREVMEEAGLRVKNIRYYKSQPWGVALDLLAGFFCEVDGDTAIRMDESELKYAEWVRREDIVLQPNDYSLTNEMMRLFRDGELPPFHTRQSLSGEGIG